MFVVYNRETTRIMRARMYGKDSYATQGAARAFLTRMVKKGYRAEDFAVATLKEYHNSIEKTVTVRNLLSGAAVTQSVNTPLCCDPSSETYHSM